MAAWGSLIKYWPYNLSLTLANYNFTNFDASGWDSYFNSVEMAVGAAVFGTTLMFVGAWLNEKTREFFFMSLMDMPVAEAALREAWRVLRSGGFLQFSITHPWVTTIATRA